MHWIVRFAGSLVIALLLMALVAAYLIFLLPVALLFFAFALWGLAEGIYKKPIPFNKITSLLILPILGFIVLIGFLPFFKIIVGVLEPLFQLIGIVAVVYFFWSARKPS